MKKLEWINIVPILIKYIEWLSLCEKELTDYFYSKMGETLSEDWYRSIEVFSAFITFLTVEDFGATIDFGENIFADHTIEMDIDKYEIINDVLIG